MSGDSQAAAPPALLYTMLRYEGNRNCNYSQSSCDIC